MEVDTGAEASVMSEAKFRQFFPEAKLHPSHIQLKSYTGNNIPVCGETMVQVTYGAQSALLPLVVVTGDRLSLMGRNWLHEIKLDWKNIATVTCPQSSSPEALIRYLKVFQNGLGTFNGEKVKIQVCPGANPRFHKARPVPFAIRDAAEQELDKLESEGIYCKSCH